MSVTLQQTNHLIQPDTALEVSETNKRIPLSSGSLTAGTWLVTGEFEIRTSEGHFCELPRLECILTTNGERECSGILETNQTLPHNAKFPYTFDGIISKATDFKLGMDIEYAIKDPGSFITVKRLIAVKV